MGEVAQRDAMEEAGVLGGARLVGFWPYKSRSYVDRTFEGFMFQLRVADELHQWPEMASRKRTLFLFNSFARGKPMQFHHKTGHVI
jgi:diphosphoinositol-polyphosphate diphosphatase